MRIKVLPGQNIVFQHSDDFGVSTRCCKVLAVNMAALTVADYLSTNGLAVIQCHGGSNTGEYYYELTYFDGNERRHFSTTSVLRIEDMDGQQIKGRFIEN